MLQEEGIFVVPATDEEIMLDLTRLEHALVSAELRTAAKQITAVANVLAQRVELPIAEMPHGSQRQGELVAMVVRLLAKEEAGKVVGRSPTMAFIGHR